MCTYLHSVQWSELLKIKVFLAKYRITHIRQVSERPHVSTLLVPRKFSLTNAYQTTKLCVCIHMCVCVCMYNMCVCVCACMREREREHLCVLSREVTWHVCAYMYLITSGRGLLVKLSLYVDSTND